MKKYINSVINETFKYKQLPITNWYMFLYTKIVNTLKKQKMELELLFSDQKWNILKSLSEGKYSPLQLAEKLNTTMANISQQLRLLEAANLVKKEKIKNRDKGKPRTLFSLSEDCAYLIPTMNDFAAKKLLKVNDHQKIILRIWFLENPETHQQLEKFYWKIEPSIDKVDAILFNVASREIYVISKNQSEIEKLVGKSKFATTVFSNEDAQKLVKLGRHPFSNISSLSTIYDKTSLFTKNGGLQK